MPVLAALPLNLTQIQDIVLLIICGLACLYCAILNKRVKALSDLKSGVGASIVSLTDAVQKNQNATKQTEQTTRGAIDTLRTLMSQAEALITKLEARQIDLDRKIEIATQLQAQLDDSVKTELPAAITKARGTATNLLKVVSDISSLKPNTKDAAPSKGAAVTPKSTTSSQKAASL